MDANGNLTSRDDFTDGLVVRFVSRMDPNVALGCSGLLLDPYGNPLDYMTTSVQRLPVDPDNDPTLFTVQSSGDGVTFSLHPNLSPYWNVYWSSDAEGYTRLQVLPDARLGPSDGYQTRFRADFVEDCWFAMNNPDGSQVVDVWECQTSQGTMIIMFPWNGGDNQIWRAQKMG